MKDSIEPDQVGRRCHVVMASFGFMVVRWIHIASLKSDNKKRISIGLPLIMSVVIVLASEPPLDMQVEGD